MRLRTDRHRMTALHCASLYGHSDVVLALLKAGADKNAPAAGGKTPLHLAAEAGGLEVAKVLLEFGCEKLVVAISLMCFSKENLGEIGDIYEYLANYHGDTSY